MTQSEQATLDGRPRVYNKHHKNAPRDALYCGRGSIAGNPFVIGEDGDRDTVCNLYEEWAPNQPWWPRLLTEAQGRDLLCFCAPLRCHCDFILREANK
jgi:hypothetical protein